MARPLFRPNVERMSAYMPGEQPAAGSRTIKLNTNENPYPPSPRVKEAVAGVADDALRLYPDPLALKLRAEAAKLWGVDVGWVLPGNGSDEILALLVDATTGEGERVAYPVPTYTLYRTLIEARGAEAAEMPWAVNGSLPGTLAATGARLIFVARPNAPTGHTMPLGELRALAGCFEGIVCVDEAYADFADDNALDLVREFSNVVVARTLSKSYSLAGMRIGFAIGSPRALDGLWKIKDSYNLDRLAIAAGAAALSDDGWMRENVRRIRATRERLTESLRALGFGVEPSQTNFVLARMGEPAARETYLALKARGILVRYFDQEGLRDALRISVGTDADSEALLAALGEIRRGAI